MLHKLQRGVTCRLENGSLKTLGYLILLRSCTCINRERERERCVCLSVIAWFLLPALSPVQLGHWLLFGTWLTWIQEQRCPSSWRHEEWKYPWYSRRWVKHSDIHCILYTSIILYIQLSTITCIQFFLWRCLTLDKHFHKQTNKHVISYRNNIYFAYQSVQEYVNGDWPDSEGNNN